MLFRLLGPVEVSDGDRPVRLGEGKQRAVLVLLLLHRNEAVSSDRLIDALWGEAPPATAAKVLQNHVGQLRRALDDREGQRLQTRGRGYVLQVQDGELDVDRFDRLAEEGAQALARERPADAAARLREALALWRGSPLADVAYEAFAQPEIARLEERHVAALEQRIDADLALGRHADVVAELEGLVAQHPLRERLRAQLMVALYRCGRQADALEAYGEARRVLLDELGVEPGPALRELQAAILRQDPELAPAPRRVAAPTAFVTAPDRAAGRRRRPAGRRGRGGGAAREQRPREGPGAARGKRRRRDRPRRWCRDRRGRRRPLALAPRRRREDALGHQRRRAQRLARRPRRPQRPADGPGRQRPRRCGRRRGRGVGGQQPRRHGLANRREHEQRRAAHHRRDQPDGRGRRRRRGMGGELRRADDLADRPAKRTAPPRSTCTPSQPSWPSAPARCG